MPTLTRDDIELFYTDSGGEGPPVLFSHGFLMDHMMFDPQVEALSPDYRCLRWDARGFGRSGVGGPFSYWDLAEDAMAVLDAAGAERAVLVGMSQGGFLSLRAAPAHPARVRALVLIDTQPAPEEPETQQQYEQMLTALTGDDASARSEVYDIVAGLIIGEPQVEESWKQRWAEREPGRLAQPGRTLLDRDDITDRLGEIRCPALVIHGEDDQAIPLQKAQTMAAELPEVRDLVRVPGAAHAPNLTHPDRVNAALRSFLDGLE